MAKRKKQYGLVTGEHKKRAALHMKAARYHLKQMNASLKSGNCDKATRRMADLQFALGEAFAHRGSEYTPRQRVAMKKRGYAGSGIARIASGALRRFMARCPREG